MANPPLGKPDPNANGKTKPGQNASDHAKPDPAQTADKARYEVDRTQPQRTDTRKAEMGGTTSQPSNTRPGDEPDADAARVARDKGSGGGIDRAVSDGVDDADRGIDPIGGGVPRPM